MLRFHLKLVGASFVLLALLSWTLSHRHEVRQHLNPWTLLAAHKAICQREEQPLTDEAFGGFAWDTYFNPFFKLLPAEHTLDFSGKLCETHPAMGDDAPSPATWARPPPATALLTSFVPYV